MTAVVEVRDLSVGFATDYGEVEAVDEVSFEVREGEVLGLVGESGSGKSVTATAILRLIRKPGRLTQGSIMLGGRDLCRLNEDELQQIRGTEIALISQTPRTALNPLLTVGQQVARMFVLHAGLTKAESRKRAIEMLALVGIPEPERRARQYAHQFSGGMCQRVMIAMALATRPRLLIADEPTTGLDVSTAARILDLLRELGRETGASILLITHDLGVVATTCHRVAVMHAGQVVEVAPVRALFRHPAHPYTRALVRSIPRVDREITMEPIPGAVPSLLNAPAGCRYADRCPWVEERCRRQKPAMTEIAPEHFVACFAVEDGRAAPV
ncbi:MAG: ATP-binding cassette domain-containing protein [Rhodospirillales bacterium]|nr:ATP-binding cassette domain-containing protein [Rhodospirillales bacterium]